VEVLVLGEVKVLLVDVVVVKVLLLLSFSGVVEVVEVVLDFL